MNCNRKTGTGSSEAPRTPLSSVWDAEVVLVPNSSPSCATSVTFHRRFLTSQAQVGLGTRLNTFLHLRAGPDPHRISLGPVDVEMHHAHRPFRKECCSSCWSAPSGFSTAVESHLRTTNDHQSRHTKAQPFRPTTAPAYLPQSPLRDQWALLGPAL